MTGEFHMPANRRTLLVTGGIGRLVRLGYHAVLAPAVKELSRREPEPVRSYLARHVDVLRSGKATVEL